MTIIDTPTLPTDRTWDSEATDRYADRYDELFGLAATTANKIVQSRTTAEDVAQETLVRALRNWSSIEAYAEPWVVRVSRNLAIDTWRRDRRLQPHDDRGPDGVRHDDDRELRLDVSEAIRSLSHRQRETVILRYVHGYSPNETAGMLGISRAGVLKNTTRALSHLRHELAPAV